MKYTQEDFKQMVLSAVEDNGYHDALWGEQGGKEAREDKGYNQGYADALIHIYNMLYNVPDFYKSQEVLDAYEEGEARYFNS